MLKVLVFTVVLFNILYGTNAQKPRCYNPSKTVASGTHAPEGIICPGDLIFEDNFDELDLKKWNHEQTLGGGGNWEFQWYTNNRSNSYVDGGILYIKPTLLADEKGEGFLWSGTLDINGGTPADECTDPRWYGCRRTGTSLHSLNPVKSARMRSVYSFSFRYGKVEVRAKLPSGDWLFPAIILLPRYNQYSGWPLSGQIDLMTSRGNRNLVNASGVNVGSKLVKSTLHWGLTSSRNMYKLTYSEKYDDAGFDVKWHNYQMTWTPNDISFSIDNEVIATFAPPDGGFWEWGNLTSTGFDNPWKRNSKMAPFDQEFYIVLNLACGGVAYFPDDLNNQGGKPWVDTSGNAASDFWKGKKQWFPTWQLKTDQAAFKIDYVRIWAL